MDEKTRLDLLDRSRDAAKSRSLSRKTENAYLNHIRRFLEFIEGHDLSKLKTTEIRAFFNHLETTGRFASATQNQAVCALTFFYRNVFGSKQSPSFQQIRRARPLDKSPVIFTPEEVRAVLSHLKGDPFLAAALAYGAGLRLAEALCLRVGDIEFGRGEIIVRNIHTGVKDRTTILPKSIVPLLKKHLAEVRFLHEDDCLRGKRARVLPPAARRKYPDGEREWRWQYIFPACKLTAEGNTFRRHHLAESTVQKAINEAIKKARIIKKAHCQNLRYSFAARLFEKNTDVRTIQTLLGHKNLKTTLGYTNYFGRSENTVQSPLDY
jgi:integron integrase